MGYEGVNTPAQYTCVYRMYTRQPTYYRTDAQIIISEYCKVFSGGCFNYCETILYINISCIHAYFSLIHI